MQLLPALEKHLRNLDGRGYNAYKALGGRCYQAHGFVLAIDHVQGDPFADASRVRALLPADSAALPEWALREPARRSATADFLTRVLHRELNRRSVPYGSGKSGQLFILEPGQQVLQRACLSVNAAGAVEARFRVGLPARGRTILGDAAAELLVREVPAAVDAALVFAALDAEALRRHVETAEDAQALRAQLRERNLVAFVADGACLPRESGVSDCPLAAERTVPFRSPEPLRVALAAPNAGTVVGMGVPVGVTLVVGGGFHGKSTLLRALERGVYDHVPGDGRERVVTVADAVKVRAEDGRSVAGTDISNFIGNLPGGEDTRHFQTANASGSTSQAASIAEALEVGATCLLLDEDTSATNFMIRDARMQRLIASSAEPITPFVDRAREMSREQGVSAVLVVGGSGDYLDVADTVIAMHAYQPEEVTERAAEVARALPTRRAAEGGPWRPLAERVPLPGSLEPGHGRHAVHVKAHTEERLLFGAAEVELSAVEQLVETAQTRALGRAVAWAQGGVMDGRRTLPEVLRSIMDTLHNQGLDAFQEELTGELAAFRVFELSAFLNRIRGLRTRPAD